MSTRKLNIAVIGLGSAMALVGKRQPFPHAKQTANWTCTGILAHQSAMEGGAIKHLPKETLS